MENGVATRDEASGPMATLGHVRGRGPKDTSSHEVGTQETLGGMKLPKEAEGTGNLIPSGCKAGSGYPYNAKNLPQGEAGARGRARTGTSLKDTGF